MNPRNFSIISFPFLGLELNPPRTFAIGPVNIHFYGLIIAVAMLLSYFGGMESTAEGVVIVVCALIYFVIAGGVLVALTQRWKEIDGGEEDEARKY